MFLSTYTKRAVSAWLLLAAERTGQGPNLRDGSLDPNRAGPLGARLIRRLTDRNAPDGIVLDAWIDADGVLRGAAAQLVPPTP